MAAHFSTFSIIKIIGTSRRSPNRQFINLSLNQHGFCKRRGTNSALITASQFIHDDLNLKDCKLVAGVFLDLKKAFDQVPHVLLLQWLHLDHRLPPKILHWLASYLAGRSQYVVVGDCFSDMANVTSGVPQGSILGPLLFVAHRSTSAGLFSSFSKFAASRIRG